MSLMTLTPNGMPVTKSDSPPLSVASSRAAHLELEYGDGDDGRRGRRLPASEALSFRPIATPPGKTASTLASTRQRSLSRMPTAREASDEVSVHV